VADAAYHFKSAEAFARESLEALRQERFPQATATAGLGQLHAMLALVTTSAYRFASPASAAADLRQAIHGDET
jgi:plasmid stability protein